MARQYNPWDDDEWNLNVRNTIVDIISVSQKLILIKG